MTPTETIILACLLAPIGIVLALPWLGPWLFHGWVTQSDNISVPITEPLPSLRWRLPYFFLFWFELHSGPHLIATLRALSLFNPSFVLTTSSSKWRIIPSFRHYAHVVDVHSNTTIATIPLPSSDGWKIEILGRKDISLRLDQSLQLHNNDEMLLRLEPGRMFWTGNIILVRPDLPDQVLAAAVTLSWYIALRAYFDSTGS